MFIALYRWKLKPGKERQFRRAWSTVTLALRERFGSLGSRLHRCEDGTWAAYAQWPNKKSWKAERKDAEIAAAGKLMRASIAESLPSSYMTVRDDYLIAAKAKMTDE
jgi:heme-degrading monooxygenase HmoA